MSGFQSYLEAAHGRSGLWRIVVGLLIIVAFWIAGTAVVLIAWVLIMLAGGTPMPEAMKAVGQAGAGGSPKIIAIMLATFIGVWAGIFVVQKALHGVPFRSVFAANLRVHWGDLFKGILLSLAFTVPGAIISLSLTDAVRTDLDLGRWAVWLLPLIALIFIQATGEELIFRGYLLQQLANWSRSPAVWAGIPSILFGLMHFNPSLPDGGGYYYVLVTLLSGLTLALLVWRAGNLWAATGLHLATNVMGLLVIGADGVLTGTQLWLLPASDMAVLFQVDLAASALMLALVASPLGRVFGDAGREDPAEVAAFD